MRDVEKITAEIKKRARARARTHSPENSAFQKFIGEDWGERPAGPARAEVADYTPARRAKLGELFPKERLVFPAGIYKVRSNDTDYRFRAHSAFAHLTGLGVEQEPNAVLVLHPQEETSVSGASGTSNNANSNTTHRAVLYFHPRTARSDAEFYNDPQYGEFWVGARLSRAEMSTLTGLEVKNITELEADLEKDLGKEVKNLRIIRRVDKNWEQKVAKLRSRFLPAVEEAESTEKDFQLEEAASELRLRKDAWEIAQMEAAIAATARGFREIIKELPRARQHVRGERVVEGAFSARAREEGNGLGYETIAASGNHANTLHWIRNDGPVREGDLILIDAGIEIDSLYTADITRTLPVSGSFTPIQKKIYNAVLAAADAAFGRAGEPGVRFRDVHSAAMEVIVAHLQDWGIIPDGEAGEFARKQQYYRRWMPHGTSHHLGIDVHDCAQARREMYQEALLAPGMIFTIEPGLYFRADDLKVPPEFRGIGVRIEDDILVTESGVRRLSEFIPRSATAVENWIAEIQDNCPEERPEDE